MYSMAPHGLGTCPNRRQRPMMLIQGEQVRLLSAVHWQPDHWVVSLLVHSRRVSKAYFIVMRENTMRIVWKNWIVLNEELLRLFSRDLALRSTRVQHSSLERLDPMVSGSHCMLTVSPTRLQSCMITYLSDPCC
jgi:hypothetical protein